MLKIPKIAKNRGCSCPIRTPNNALTYRYPHRKHREHSLWGYQNLLLLCLQVLKADWSVGNDSPALLMVFLYACFKVWVVSYFNLRFYYLLSRVEIRPWTEDLYFSTCFSSKGEPPCNLLLNIFSLKVQNRRWVSSLQSQKQVKHRKPSTIITWQFKHFIGLSTFCFKKMLHC